MTHFSFFHVKISFVTHSKKKFAITEVGNAQECKSKAINIDTICKGPDCKNFP